MKITSLARKTDLIFSEFEGEVVDCGHYTIIRTPQNPGYHWGNFLIFEQSPSMEDLPKWRELFLKEFGDRNHMLFAWNHGSADSKVVAEFTKLGFEHQKNLVLSTNKLNPPKKANREIEIRMLESDDDWEQGIQLGVLTRDAKYDPVPYEDFKRRQFQKYREMNRAGIGARFGAFLGRTLVGDLGLFHKDGVGRYQNVSTHPDYRRQGICGTLVYQAGTVALNQWGVETLVMEADPDYHAARIYESVGFKPAEESFCFYWSK